LPQIRKGIDSESDTDNRIRTSVGFSIAIDRGAIGETVFVGIEKRFVGERVILVGR